MDTQSAITTGLPLVTPFIHSIIDTWLKPKLEELVRNNKLDAQIYEYSFGDKFEEYLNRTYDYYSYISTIVFQNQQKELKDLYIPLTLQMVSTDNIVKEYIINEYTDDFVPIYKNVLITDTAGMGKSTVLKWLYLSCVEKSAALPLFVELRKLSKTHSILDEIYKQLNPINLIIDKQFILELINRGDFIFFLDGYDEIPFKDRSAVTSDLQAFISKSNNNYFVLTSRPENALASFTLFQQFKIRPLNDNEAYLIIQKYDSYGDVSSKLIKDLTTGAMHDNIKEFLTNPLMVTLLYRSFDYKSVIPNKKSIFYRQVYDSLFDRLDLTKGDSYIHEKRSYLDTDDFHRILRTFGFITYRLGKIEYDKDEILQLIDKSKNNCPNITFQNSDFLDDLLIAVPLFRKEGDYYKWAHKSLQEYFAAEYIWLDADKNKERILLNMSDNISSNYNLIDLYYDIDYKNFRNIIIYQIVKDYIKYCKEKYTKIDTQLIDNNLIAERLKLHYSIEIVVLTIRYDQNNPLQYFPSSDKLSMIYAHRIQRTTISYDILYAYNKNFYYIELMSKKGNQICVNRTKGNREYLNLMFLENNKIYYIDDNPENIFNSKDNFRIVNNMLLDTNISESTRPCLILDACEELLFEIEKDLQKENSENYFDLI
jgi:hypothetical protein